MNRAVVRLLSSFQPYDENDPRCQPCGEPIDWDSPNESDTGAEFNLDGEALVAHVQCGLDLGLEIA